MKWLNKQHGKVHPSQSETEVRTNTPSSSTTNDNHHHSTRSNESVRQRASSKLRLVGKRLRLNSSDQQPPSPSLQSCSERGGDTTISVPPPTAPMVRSATCPEISQDPAAAASSQKSNCIVSLLCCGRPECKGQNCDQTLSSLRRRTTSGRWGRSTASKCRRSDRALFPCGTTKKQTRSNCSNSNSNSNNSFSHQSLQQVMQALEDYHRSSSQLQLSILQPQDQEPNLDMAKLADFSDYYDRCGSAPISACVYIDGAQEEAFEQVLS